MTRRDRNPDELERFVDQALRDLGQRRAPLALEHRVHAEIARRAALPWWRNGFAQWPLAARLAFMIASVGFVKLAFIATMWMFATVDATGVVTPLMTWMRRAEHVSSSMIDLGMSLAGLIPPIWIYGGLALCALLYAALFGLGAVGYSILYASPATRGLSRR
jgi:hypothetical protein